MPASKSSTRYFRTPLRGGLRWWRRAVLLPRLPSRWWPRIPDSADEGQLPTYNSYSASGDVTTELVYVNYGIPEDYKKLAELGISVEGKIVIARYGKSWRGTKVKVAAEHGAVGCVIYSDPRDDGYFQGDVYPEGPYRPPMGVQRGSVMDMPLYTGGPLVAWLALGERNQTFALIRGTHGDDHPGATNLSRGGTATARSHRRSRGAGILARKLATHIPHWSRSGEGTAGGRF